MTAMRDSATVLREGRYLTPDLTAALDGSEAEAVYAVHIQKLAPEAAAFFLETRAKVQEGIADADSGNIIDAEDFYREIEAKYGIKARR